MANLKDLQEEMSPYKNTLVLDGFEVVRLVNVIDGSDDYYWVYDTRKGTVHATCVGGWIPLKGFIPSNEYNSLVRIWNLNNIIAAE